MSRTEAAERLVRAGEELFAIAEAALLQDAVDRYLTNEAMQEWTRAQSAFTNDLAAERAAGWKEGVQHGERLSRLAAVKRIRKQVETTWRFGGSDEKVEALAYVLRVLDGEAAR